MRWLDLLQAERPRRALGPGAETFRQARTASCTFLGASTPSFDAVLGDARNPRLIFRAADRLLHDVQYGKPVSEDTLPSTCKPPGRGATGRVRPTNRWRASSGPPSCIVEMTPRNHSHGRPSDPRGYLQPGGFVELFSNGNGTASNLVASLGSSRLPINFSVSAPNSWKEVKLHVRKSGEMPMPPQPYVVSGQGPRAQELNNLSFGPRGVMLVAVEGVLEYSSRQELSHALVKHSWRARRSTRRTGNHQTPTFAYSVPAVINV